jgi:DNA-binding NarL/FixJ family response regulator
MEAITLPRGEAVPAWPFAPTPPTADGVRGLESLLAALERGGVALALFDDAGRLRRSTAALGDLLDADGDREQLRLQLRRLAGEARQGRPESDEARSLLVRTRRGSYRLVAGEVAMPRGRGLWTVIVVQPLAMGGVSDEALRAGWALSPREVEVARLLALGETLPQIAAQLRLSVHTVRHHTEGIYAKLGVRTRTALTALLCGAGEASAPSGREPAGDP